MAITEIRSLLTSDEDSYFPVFFIDDEKPANITNPTFTWLIREGSSYQRDTKARSIPEGLKATLADILNRSNSGINGGNGIRPDIDVQIGPAYYQDGSLAASSIRYSNVKFDSLVRVSSSSTNMIYSGMTGMNFILEPGNPIDFSHPDYGGDFREFTPFEGDLYLYDKGTPYPRMNGNWFHDNEGRFVRPSQKLGQFDNWNWTDGEKTYPGIIPLTSDYSLPEDGHLPQNGKWGSSDTIYGWMFRDKSSIYYNIINRYLVTRGPSAHAINISPIMICWDGVFYSVSFHHYTPEPEYSTTPYNPGDNWSVSVNIRPSYTFDTKEINMARFNPRTGTSNIGCYIMSKTQVNSWMGELWSTDLIESIRNSLIGDGSNSVLGLKWYYGIKDTVMANKSRQFCKVTLGNVVFPNEYAYASLKEFIPFDFGSIEIPRYYNDYRDYELITYQVYLPFIGFVTLDPNDIIGKTIYLKYWINITDGSAVCIVSTTPMVDINPTNNGTIFTTTCSWGYDIPIRVEPMMDIVSRLASMGTKNLYGTMTESANYSVGDLSPNSNIMGDFQAKLVMHRKDDLSGAMFEDALGLPGADSQSIGSASGFVKAEVVYNAGALSMREADKIIELLKEGIYVS